MADPDDKVELNVDGAWYVDSECINCDVCRETAPENFKEADEDEYSYVYKQPENDDEVTACEEAMEECPVEAIGNDG